MFKEKLKLDEKNWGQKIETKSNKTIAKIMFKKIMQFCETYQIDSESRVRFQWKKKTKQLIQKVKSKSKEKSCKH